MAKALPVLHLNDKSFQIDADAFKSVLAKVGDRPFALISINGTTRTGKSYILSHFVRYFESKKRDPECTNWYDNASCANFVWRSGRERETVGINLWSEPYFVKTHTGEEIAVLLIDTQGLFDEQTSARQNAIIFSISTLCSSVMIFNIMRFVDENILQQVEFFSGYAHMASAYQDTDETQDEARVGGDANYAHGSNMLFLIRDFELAEYGFGLHSSSKMPEDSEKNFYRETFIMEDRTECAEENKIVRQNILRSFRHVSLYCLPDPGKQFKREKNPAMVPVPDEEFKENVIAFVEHMVQSENLVKKKVLDVPTTGFEFQKYIDNWAKMCKQAQEVFPDVLTVAENTAYTQYSIALNLAVSKYKNDMDNYVKENPGTVTPDELKAVHLGLVQAAQTIFDQAQKRRNPKFDEKFTEDLASNLEHCYELAKRDNAMYREVIANNERNERVLQEKMREMDTHMAEERKRVDGLIRGFKDVNETLRETNIRLAQEARAKSLENKKLMEENQKRIEKLLEQNRELSSSAKKSQEENNEALRENAEAIKRLRENNEKLNDVATERENESKRLMKENTKAIKQLREDNAKLSRKMNASQRNDGCHIL